jgi:hypothetical protein
MVLEAPPDGFGLHLVAADHDLGQAVHQRLGGAGGSGK